MKKNKVDNNNTKKEKTYTIVKIPLLAIIVLCILIIALVIINRNEWFGGEKVTVANNGASDETITDETGRTWKVKRIEENSNVVMQSSAVELKWDEKTITQKFYSVYFMNNTYDSSNGTSISNDLIGQSLGTASLIGNDSYTDSDYTTTATVYEIKDYPTNCMIALQFEGDSNFYIYINTFYRPDTLGDFIDDLNLKENVTFGTINYNYSYTDNNGEWQYAEVEFYDVNNDDIWNMLFIDTSLENVQDDLEVYTNGDFNISINVDIPFLGSKRVCITLTDRGYLTTNIFETGKAFYIGEDKVQEFLNYLVNNYDGYRLIYEDTAEEENLDNEIEDSGTIMVTQNSINGTTTEEVNTSEFNNLSNFTNASSNENIILNN